MKILHDVCKPLWSLLRTTGLEVPTKKQKKQWFSARSLVWVSLCYCKLAGRCSDYCTRISGGLLACFFLFICVLWLFFLFLTLCVNLSPMAAVCCNYHTHVQLNCSVIKSGCLAGLSRHVCVPGLGNVLFSSFKSADSKSLGQPGHQLPQNTLTTFIWKDSILKDEDGSLIILMSDYRRK